MSTSALDRSRHIRSRLIPFLVIATLAAGILACNASTVTNLFASPTPTSTDTPTPTPTFTPTPTTTSTPTPTQTPTPKPSGINIKEQPDGTSLLTDLDNNYQIIIPENWSPILISQEHELISPINAEQNYPQYKGLADQLKDLDTEYMRLISIETEEKYLNGNYPTFLSVTVTEDIDPIFTALGMAALTAWIEDHPLANAEKISWDVKINPNGIEVGINDAVQDMPTRSGPVSVRSKLISFVAQGKLVIVEIFTPEQFSESLFSKMESIIDTIELTAP